MKKTICLIPLIVALMAGCSNSEDLKEAADKITQTIESELPGIAEQVADKAQDLKELIPDFVFSPAAYNEISNYEKEIAKEAQVQIAAQNGQVTVSLGDIAEAVHTANSLKSTYTQQYAQNNETEQVKEIETTVTALITGAKDSALISLSKDLANADVDNIVFSSGDVTITFTPEMLSEEFNTHGNISVAIEKTDSSHSILFQDEDGNQIKLANNATVTIASKRLKDNSVIYNIQEGVKDLIGGKVEDGKLTFQIKFGGDFETGDNSAKFDDISHLDKDTQNAILAMATKGVFSTETGSFNPEGAVSRAEAVTMVTKTLYKYDESNEAGFADVTGDDWYYTAVASGVAEGIVSGYPDDTFRPENTISKQELLTIASSTLISDRKFLLPYDPSDYLGDFEEEIAQWARPYVGMAIRDGVVEQAYATEGAGDITRADAAVVLYNLFELL